MKSLYVTTIVLALLLGLISSVALATPIPVTAVTASSYFTSASGDRPPQKAIDGSGLSGTFPNQTHGRDPSTMWLTENDDLQDPNDNVADAWIQFDLGSVYNLESANIWNYNQFSGAPYTNRGIKKVDIYVSTLTTPGDPEAGGASDWTPLFTDKIFAQASGAATDAGFTLDFFGNVLARYVRFEIDSNYSPDPYGNYVGLSEIQFNAVPEPATMLLLGSGLIGIGAFVRRKFKK